MRPFSIGILLAAAVATSLIPLFCRWTSRVTANPLASIVIPSATGFPVESYAAQELQYHIESSTYMRLAIVRENDSRFLPIARISNLGHCAAASAEKIDTSQLAGNGYIAKTNAENLFITGKDSDGDLARSRDTQEGTLFGVYDILENNLGVQWLWPGKLGEVIPRNKSLSLSPHDAVVQPLLWFKQWRNDSLPGERVWLKRQRFGRSIRPHYRSFLRRILGQDVRPDASRIFRDDT